MLNIPNHSKLLTPKQTAEILGIKECTLSAWRFHKRQPLVYVKVGSKVMYPEDKLLEFIASRTCGSTDKSTKESNNFSF